VAYTCKNQVFFPVKLLHYWVDQIKRHFYIWMLLTVLF